MYLRRWLQETPIFLEMQQRKALAEELPLKSVIVNHKKAIVVSMLMTWLLSAGIVVVILMAPTWLQKQLGIRTRVDASGEQSSPSYVVFGCIVAGWIIDRFGASKTFIVGSLFLGSVQLVFYHLTATHPNISCSMYALVGSASGLLARCRM